MTISSISPSDDPPRNIGVIFDSTCCSDAHRAKMCRSYNFDLYSVGKTKYIDGSTAEKIINDTVASRLDYCISLSYWAKQPHVDRLQIFQNNAAMIISKGASLAIYPQYLTEWISEYVSPRLLRSEDQYLLNSLRWRLETFGKQALPKAVRPFVTPYPSAWNKSHL